VVPEAFPSGAAGRGQLTGHTAGGEGGSGAEASGPLLVLTVTPNPSLDLLFQAAELAWDDANRVPEPRRRPGGQGVNVARAVRALGGQAAAAVLLGGRTGAEIEHALRDEGLPLHVVAAAAETRTFVAVRELAHGRSLLLNARGHARSKTEADALRDVVLEALRADPPAWLAGCGSLPAGFDDAFYRDLARAARSRGVRVVVDCDDDPLRRAAPYCDLLVPNHHEAARLTGIRIDDARSAAGACRRLREFGAAVACVTLGAAGAVLVNGAGAWHAAPPPAGSGSAVGAGDTFLAALLLALEGGLTAPDSLRRAVAAATATLDSEGAALVDAGRARHLEADTTVTALE